MQTARPIVEVFDGGYSTLLKNILCSSEKKQTKPPRKWHVFDEQTRPGKIACVR